MTRISRPFLEDAGFTLVELLVVLTIMGLLAVLVVPRIGQRPAAIARAQAVTQLGTAIARARRMAQTSGTPQTLDPARVVAASQWQADETQSPGLATSLIFYPDGSSTGGRIVMAGKPVMTISWLNSVVVNP